MRITDELRKWGYGFCGDTYDVMTAIADRIDAEHEEAIQQALMGEGGVPATDENMAEHGWVRMPEDADGEYWFCGDKIVLPDGNVVEIIGIGGDWLYYCVGSVATTVFGRIRAHDKHHYRAPTVEDVLREFAADVETAGGVMELPDATLAEYAAKLRLAGEE